MAKHPKQSTSREEAVLLFGRKPLLELFRHRPERIAEVFIAEGVKPSDELSSFLEQARTKGVRFNTISREELDEKSAGISHQGFAAHLRPSAPPSLEDLLRSAVLPSPLLVLDQINDPQNLGAILRAAEAAGAKAVLRTTANSAPLSAAARRASAGASELLDVIDVKNLQRALERLKKAGYWIIGTDVSPQSRSVFEVELPLPTALVLGSEGTGMRRLTREVCDVLVHLPIAGVVESLNVSQAASVFLYEILRRRLVSPPGGESAS